MSDATEDIEYLDDLVERMEAEDADLDIALLIDASEFLKYLRDELAGRDKAVPDTNAIATALTEAWASSEPDSLATRYPQSYVATFADMAKAVRTMLTAAPEARSEAEIQAEALEAQARKLNDLAELDVKGPQLLMPGLDAAATELRTEAARLREGEK